MTANTSKVVYLTPSSEAERELLNEILEPHSWAAGEFGLMLTDAAFEECVKYLPPRTEKSVKAFLRAALLRARKARAGDVSLNFGIAG